MKYAINRLIFFLIGGIGAGIVLIVFFIIWYVSIFLATAQISFSQLKNIAISSFSYKEKFSHTSLPFLILGLDNRKDELESTLLTDTILIASVDAQKNTITLIPLPRDLWIDPLKTKINALYFYGEERKEETGISYLSKNIAQITGITPQYYISLNYKKLPLLINLIGGITINVPHAFIDTSYPNPDYLTDHSKQKYITVSFEKGIQTMDGMRTLEYIRSRSSSDQREGSDFARSKRQMQVFSALLSKLSRLQSYQNPKQTGLLYRFWHDAVETNLNDSMVLALGLIMLKEKPSVYTINIPTGSDTTSALLKHPPEEKYGLWVLEPVDPSWKGLHEFFQKNLDKK